MPAMAADRAPPSGLPALQAYEAPAFPAELAAHAVSQGYALVAFTVDAQGHVEDSFTLDSSHPAFADAATEALGKWQLAPAKDAPLPRREVIRFAFSREGTVSSYSQMDAMLNQFPVGSAEQLRTLPWNRLPAPPQRIAGDKPAVPAAGTGGNAIISFVIDAQGRVRVPAIQRATDKSFAEQALAAVKQWRYAPPRHEGEPVAVTMAQSFSYGPAAAAP